jgi:hypothetical protein
MDLRMFENKVPRRIFGHKRGEGVKSPRKLHNEEFHNLYPSASTVRTRRLVGHVAHGKTRNAQKPYENHEGEYYL